MEFKQFDALDLFNLEIIVTLQQISPLDTQSFNFPVPGDSHTGTQFSATSKPIHIIYFMDPICSSCWSMEPHIRKLIFEYGDSFSIEYRMGGLLEKLSEAQAEKDNMVTEIATHWNQMDAKVAMPIDGDIWLEDPIFSSYPPSIAFKAATLQDSVKALNFLRSIREMVFLFKKNISRWDVIEPAAISAGLDTQKLQHDIKTAGKSAFEEDLSLAKKISINWFPTLFFVNEKGLQEMVSGPRNFNFYQQILIRLNPDIVKSSRKRNVASLFEDYNSFTTGEVAELLDCTKEDCLLELNELHQRNQVEMLESKNGVLWRKIMH